MAEQKVLGRVTVARRKDAWGQWVVRAYDSAGKRYPAADYYTDDKHDAHATAQAMLQPRCVICQGGTV